jgi:hypothetical protein
MVIVPYGGYETPVARRLEVIAWFWAVAFVVASVTLRLGLGLFAFVVALGPVLCLKLPPSVLRRLPGGRLIVAAQPYAVELDRRALAFPHPDEPVRRILWDDIERMEAARWGGGRLIGRDGEPICWVQPAYVRLQRGGLGFRSRSLAVEVVRMRPDLFVLSPPENRFTQPYGFQRPTPGYNPPDLTAIDRRQVLLHVLLFVALGATIVGVVVLLPDGLPRG